MIKRYAVFSLILLLLFVAGMTAFFQAGRAQSEVELASLEVDLWPEYDRPSVLVIYRIVLSSEVSLPVDLTVRLPAASGEPNAVAVRQMDGGLFTVAYERQVSGEWGLVTFTATLPEVQLEYYDPGLVKQGEARQYEYTWPGDYAVESLAVQVQQPLGATDLRTSPGLGSGIQGQDGLTYYTAQVGSLAQGQSFDISLNYQKANDTLSAESLLVQPSAPMDDTGADLRTQLMTMLPWGLGILGVALIAGGGVWYWLSGRQKQGQPVRRQRRRVSPAAVSEPQGDFIYCHQCGKRATTSDRFCRACGTKLRRE